MDVFGGFSSKDCGAVGNLCPALLICGEKDMAGSCIRYNKAWHKYTNIPIEWIEDAGHNSNTDRPEIVNKLIEDLVKQIVA